MQCQACDLRLELDDNYCRRCGAPVRVVEVVSVPPAARGRDVVEIGLPAPPALLQAARPVVAGAAAVAAGALVRFALRRALRVALSGGVRPSNPITAPAPGVEVTEVLWYRRVIRS